MDIQPLLDAIESCDFDTHLNLASGCAVAERLLVTDPRVQALVTACEDPHAAAVVGERADDRVLEAARCKEGELATWDAALCAYLFVLRAVGSPRVLPIGTRVLSVPVLFWAHWQAQEAKKDAALRPLDDLNRRVSEKIHQAEWNAGPGAVPGLFAEVSALEQELAHRLLPFTEEGQIARRGAVRAAFSADKPVLAHRLILQYENEAGAPEALLAWLAQARAGKV